MLVGLANGCEQYRMVLDRIQGLVSQTGLLDLENGWDIIHIAECGLHVLRSPDCPK